MTQDSTTKSSESKAFGGMRHWLRQHAEAKALLLILALAAGGWIFLALAGEVGEGETAAFDHAVMLALRSPTNLADPIGPAWIQELGRDMTSLGGLGVLTIITLSVAGFLWLQGNERSMFLVVASIGGGRIFASILKMVFDRPRPELVPHSVIVSSSSFPSAHSMMSAIAYLTLAALLARTQSRRSTKIYLIVLAFFLTFVVGVSRVYLGVHWPTDVIAGWIVGSIWAFLTLFVADLMDPRPVMGNRQIDGGVE